MSGLAMAIALREHGLDVLVCAAGFDVEGSLAVPITGRGGTSLQAVWRNGAFAHLGTTVTGFPNLFLMLGPNTATGHTSTLLFIEPQVQLVPRSKRAQRGDLARLHAGTPPAAGGGGCRARLRQRLKHAQRRGNASRAR